MAARAPAGALRRSLIAALAVRHDLGLGRAAHRARAGRSAGRATDRARRRLPVSSQAEKWRYRPDQEWRVLQRYLEASGAPEESRASILVWPEGAIPTLNFFMLDNPDFLAALGRGLGDRALITGLTRCEPRRRAMRSCAARQRRRAAPLQLSGSDRWRQRRAARWRRSTTSTTWCRSANTSRSGRWSAGSTSRRCSGSAPASKPVRRRRGSSCPKRRRRWCSSATKRFFPA